MSYTSKAEELWRLCLHEHAHVAVAKYFGSEGWVDVQAAPPGSWLPHGLDFYIGRSYFDPLRYARDRHLVGWAGAVAEMLDEDSEACAPEIFERCTTGAYELSGTDLDLIGRPRLADVAACLGLLRRLWTEIVTRAKATAAAAE